MPPAPCLIALGLVLLTSACGPAAVKPIGVTTATAKRCPTAAPVLDSSCEGFAVGTSCLYADDSVGCSCLAVPPSQRSEEHPFPRAWRCGEHGE